MFKVFIRSHNLPIQRVDGRLAGGSVVGAGSTTTSIVFNPGLTGQSTTWVGGQLIFSSGYNNNIGALIGAEHKTGTTLDSVDLAATLQVAPSAGDTFWLVRKTGYPTLDSQIYDISPYIDNVSFSSDINLGFEKATITLNQRISSLGRIFSQFIGMHMEIQDGYGRRVYSGIVSSADMEGWGGTVSSVGHAASFAWFDFAAQYGAVSTTTTPQVIADICAQNPYMSRYTLLLDRDGSWASAQAAVNGIGPLDFISQRTKASDAIKEVLSLGYYPISFDKVALQVWHDMVPRIRVYRRNPTTPDYYISNHNIGFGYDGLGVTGDIADAYTSVVGDYTDSNGKNQITPSAYNVNLIPLLGIRSQSISTGNAGAAQAAAIVGVSRQDRNFLVAPGSIKIKGNIKHGSSANMAPVYLIRAGDVLAIEGNLAGSSLYRNSISSPGIFTVGHTEYSEADDSLQITAMEYPLAVELYQNIIKVGTK